MKQIILVLCLLVGAYFLGTYNKAPIPGQKTTTIVKVRVDTLKVDSSHYKKDMTFKKTITPKGTTEIASIIVDSTKDYILKITGYAAMELDSLHYDLKCNSDTVWIESEITEDVNWLMYGAVFVLGYLVAEKSN